jgi:hypothetical protein
LPLRRLLGPAIGAVVVASAAHGGVAASVFGTWVGTPRYPGQSGPNVVYTPITLVAGPAWVRVESTGPTTASHDAADAMSTCTTRYRFSSSLSVGGWRIYTQQGAPKLSGSVSGGPPSTGVCGSGLSGAYRDAVRIRPAGAKLKIEFGIANPAKSGSDPRAADFDHKYYKSGYLHR